MRVSDIAERAGVSIATVSRVLNKDPKVRPETASQVHKILEQFPYDPTAIRRGPRPGKRAKVATAAELTHGQIAIVVIGRSHEEWFKLPIFASIVSAVSRAASDRHVAVHLEEVLDASRISDRIHNGVVDGALVFVASDAKRSLVDAVRARVPIVRIAGDDLVPMKVDQVRIDNLAIGHLAFEYLSSKNCGRMACVTTRPSHGGIYLRSMAFAAAVHRERQQTTTLYTAGNASLGPMMGAEAVGCPDLDAVAAHLVKSATPDAPVGLFVTQDAETVGLYPCLTRHGLRPGEDVHVISCNNDPSIAHLSPRPATIDLNPSAIARWALRRLINRVARPDDAPIQMLISPRLLPSEAVEPM